MLPTSELLNTLSVVSVRSSRSATGSVPFRPSEFSTIICTPPTAFAGVPEHRAQLVPPQLPSKQKPLTPTQLRPYIGELLFCAGLLYGAHGCHPVRQLGSSAPLGSSAAAMVPSVTYIGASSPRLVPVKHPVPAVGVFAPAALELAAVYENVVV